MRYAPSSLFEFPALPQGYRWHITPEPEQYARVHQRQALDAERMRL